MPKTLTVALTVFVWTGLLAAQNQRKDAERMNDHTAGPINGPSNQQSQKRVHAEARIVVQNSKAKPYDQTEGPALMEIDLSEIFTGDIDGQSLVRALQMLRDDHSARLVSMQRFRGKIVGRQGTFVRQGSEMVENGKISVTCEFCS